jgi:hypothetical protein
MVLSEAQFPPRQEPESSERCGNKITTGIYR